ncbi:MAG: peptidase domain-containing ABC transporter [Clostridia bacterium]|nr:peptidase domain-containing ABC transporter [Clostridia bacterium]
MRNKIIKQHDQRDCGAACLATVARYYHCKLSVSDARMMCKTDQIGTNIYGMVSAADSLGFNAFSLQGTTHDLLQSIESGEVKFPFIAHTFNEANMQHFIVVFSLKNGRFFCGDPETGSCKLSINEFFSKWTGYIICLIPRENRIENPNKKRFPFGVHIFKGVWQSLVIVFILSLIVAGIGICSSFVFEIMIDGNRITAENSSHESHIHDEHSEQTESENYDLATEVGFFFEKIENKLSFSSFDVLFLSIIILYLVQTIIQIIRGKLILTVSKTIDIRMVLRYFCHIQDVDIEYLHTFKAGEYLSRMSDADTVRNAISSLSVSAMLDFVMLFGCGIILYDMNRTLFFISLFVLLLYTVLVLSLKNPLERSNRTIMQNNAEVQSYFKETIDGAELIRIGAYSNQIIEKVKKLYLKLANSVVKNGMLGVSMSSVSEMLEAIGSVIVLWIGYSLIERNALSLGSLVTFFVLLSYFTTPAKNLINLQPEIQSAKIAAERLRDVLDMPVSKEPENPKELPCVINTWRANHIYYRYGNRDLALKDVSVSINKGECIALVGESGSGKSTLAKLLLGLLTPENGTVLINDEDISYFSKADLCQTIAYVSQNTFLFSDTIKNNLTFGIKNIEEEKIRKICNICQLDSFIDTLPLGIDTPIEENGVNLSGGQRQRLALARALLRDPKLLILDEATSNLDTITENSIHEILETLSKEITCVVIAHRLSTIKNCDKIFVMSGGSIIEEGTHRDLLESNGYYSKLWKAMS